DPRGRALLGLRLFQDAAARLGWVILSSYNTLSDGPPEPNVNAVNAMLAWAQAHPSLDPTRLYLAGFSGTARAALGFAVALRGLRATDSGGVRLRLGGEVARAAELERLGRWAEAARLDEAIVRDYARWPQAGAAAARAAALRGNAVLARYEAEVHRLAERDLRQGIELPKIFSWARSQRDPPALQTLAGKLRIAELQRAIERGDSLEAASARRLLARVFVNLAFYEPRAYLTTGSPARALRMLEAAVTIGPIQGEACALLREALAVATVDQRARLADQCVPASSEPGQTFRNASNTGSDHQRRYRVSSASAWSAVRAG